MSKILAVLALLLTLAAPAATCERRVISDVERQSCCAEHHRKCRELTNGGVECWQECVRSGEKSRHYSCCASGGDCYWGSWGGCY